MKLHNIFAVLFVASFDSKSPNARAERLVASREAQGFRIYAWAGWGFLAPQDRRMRTWGPQGQDQGPYPGTQQHVGMGKVGFTIRGV